MAVIRGVVGRIQWGYYTAAALEGYRVVRHKKTGKWSLSGRVVMTDAFKLSQRPLVFVAPFKHGERPGEWSWPVEEINVQNHVVTAALGPPIQ